MKFSVGLWDSLFGEKVTLDIPNQDGSVIKRQVTKRWLDAMQQSGTIKELPTIQVHMLHPAGNRVLHWVIGQDVDQETVDRFRDSKSGDLFAMTHFEAGQSKMTVMRKSFWEKAGEVMDSAGERGAAAALEGVDPSSWIGEKRDSLLERAGDLVQVARINAVGMFTPLLERFPMLRQVDPEQWDFILTVAGVFMAASRLSNLRLGETREAGLMEIVAERLNQWKPDGIRGFEDCKKLFEREFDRLTAAGHEPRFVGSDAVGTWIVWNVLGRPPETDEECRLVRATGALVTQTFFNWWNT